MSKKTESNLKNWEKVDYEEELHKHFEDVGCWEWGDIAKEGMRVYELMFGEKIEDFSPAGCLFYAMTAQAYVGAISAVVAMLGIKDKWCFELLVSDWYENKDNLPKPIDIQNLLQEIQKKRKELNEA